MRFPNWFRSRKRRAPTAARRTFRPRLETLEDRTLPSTFTVLNLDDNGTGSLRQAILDANVDPDADIIQFDSGVTGTITLTSGELYITETADLQGPGAGVVTVSGNNTSRVFHVSANATISGLTITGGSSNVGGGIHNEYNGTLTLQNSILSGNAASQNGGGIANGGTLTVVSSTLSGNSALGGGGIKNDGTLTVVGSTLSDNSASYGGGGGILNVSTLTVDSSTFSGNTATAGGTGGAIGNGIGTATVRNSTLSGNTAYRGAGIANFGTLSVQNSTLSGNVGSVIWAYQGTLTVVGSSISGNYGGIDGQLIIGGAPITLNNTVVAANGLGWDIFGTVTSGSSHNLIGSDTYLSGISNGSNGNLIGTAAAPINPMLDPLQNNGGPTKTMALQLSSPALNAGDNSLIPAGITTDQRGTGFARIDDGTVDIGAYEFVVNVPPVADAGGPYIVVRGGTVQLDASATFDENEPNTGLTYEWDFDGDGYYDDATGNAPVFSAEGLVTAETIVVGLRVTDSGDLEDTATANVQVIIVGLIADPFEAGKTALAIGGTLGDDNILFNTGGTGGTVQVMLNGVSQGSFSPTGRLIAYGQAGADNIQVAGGISLPTMLLGGKGDDRIKGGAGNNILVGGDGDDLLVGGNNRDIMIGGNGADRIVGNGQDDVLIAGRTAFDRELQGLCALMAEWASNRDYATRLDNLMGLGSGDSYANRLNGNRFLTAGSTAANATVFDDGALDVLTGKSGQDWFWANRVGTGVLDKITDLSASEFANDLDFINAT